MFLRRASCRLSIYRQQSTFFTATRSPIFHSHAKRASIRPITLFALCIPLGYGLSVFLKDNDAEERDGFVKYTLASRERVSSTCSIFTLRPADAAHTLHDIPTSRRAITSVQFKQPQLQIARFYTLLPPTQEQDPHEIRFLIRKERNGEVSGYLHRLAIGSNIELRGMCVEYTLPDHVDQVVFLAGGTGIAPAMQVAAAVAGEADVHILWASRLREDCVGGTSEGKRTSADALKSMLGIHQRTSPLPDQQGLIVAQLEALKEKSQQSAGGQKHVVIDYFVDEEGSFIQRSDVAKLVTSHNSKLHGNGQKKIVFVAGPDGFINHWAASKQWADGHEVQGPLGGMLSQMNLAGWEVVKL